MKTVTDAIWPEMSELFEIGFIMWERRTFHQCAMELDMISGEFRDAYLDHDLDPEVREAMMLSASTRGIEVLRILALAIRSEQDAGLTSRVNHPVGAIRNNPTQRDTDAFLGGDYQPHWSEQADFESLDLRNALNKIAHADTKNPVSSQIVHIMICY